MTTQWASTVCYRDSFTSFCINTLIFNINIYLILIFNINIGGRSIGIVRSRTKATELLLLLLLLY
jgi:hypothetical protein